MAKELNFEGLAEEVEKNPELVEARSRRWGRRDANPTVQMSIRMLEADYEKFRQLCARERRTNGDMVNVMMSHYLRSEPQS